MRCGAGKIRATAVGEETPKGTRTCLGVTEMPPDLMVLNTSLIYTRVSRHQIAHICVIHYMLDFNKAVLIKKPQSI